MYGTKGIGINAGLPTVTLVTYGVVGSHVVLGITLGLMAGVTMLLTMRARRRRQRTYS
ncbi:MAG: hypothetical protein ACTHJM_10620 [Marmoricola sp.]